jgi:uncharacterized protein (DUF58 family)
MREEGKITAYVRVHRDCLLEARVSFMEESVQVNAPTKVKFTLRNRHESAIFVRKIAIQANLSEYDTETKVELSLKPGETKVAELSLTPKGRDVGKVIQVC